MCAVCVISSFKYEHGRGWWYAIAGLRDDDDGVESRRGGGERC